jgi:hypothetical protein
MKTNTYNCSNYFNYLQINQYHASTLTYYYNTNNKLCLCIQSSEKVENLA